jgi:hypothetical protein
MQFEAPNIVVAIVGNAKQVATSEEFSATSHSNNANSEETSAQANVESKATDLVNSNLQTVATGAEEMPTRLSELLEQFHINASDQHENAQKPSVD